ncbi:cryptochrome [Chloropicon primus]|uniref:Cryptochrome DASH n=1 Tax=Chloropicon primus TaxID=1764295 RepID=A0A5B8MNW1_9CHLO|nr:cryptochrome [Chloropicon primus]|eukprot:QDZ22001.1 cryptochrome [Chloropicon primus]
MTKMANGNGLKSSSKRLVLWFRNDLRLHDNAIVDKAKRSVASGDCKEVLPLYCFDPRVFQRSEYGSPKTGVHRAKFLVESVMDLRERLRSVGSDLLIAVNKPENVIADLVGDNGTSVFAQREVTHEERVTESLVEGILAGSERARLELFWGATLYHRGDLPFKSNLRDLPDVFTPFRNKVEKQCSVRSLLSEPRAGDLPLGDAANLPLVKKMTNYEPSLKDILPGVDVPDQDERSSLSFRGGEAAALERLRYYLWDSDLLSTYFETRNGMVGGDYSTKFSPWLANGCLSPRKIYHEISEYERERVANKSTYWVVFELIWRDFFHFYCEKHGNSVFYPGGPAGRRNDWNNDRDALRRWKEGRTGVPLVDANMRELLHTGFMSNRGRQNVASFLALDLKGDWRVGADHFESLLLDYDVCSNWGNWVSAAGLTGGRVNRFNIVKQSKDYDKAGEYIKLWIPELRKVPTQYIHKPWEMPRSVQESSGCFIGQDYPNPVATSKAWETYNKGGKKSEKSKPYRGYYEKRSVRKEKKKSNFEMYG